MLSFFIIFCCSLVRFRQQNYLVRFQEKIMLSLSFSISFTGLSEIM